MNLKIKHLVLLAIGVTCLLDIQAQVAVSTAAEYANAKAAGVLPSDMIFPQKGSGQVIKPHVKKPTGQTKGGGSSLCDCWIPIDASYTQINNQTGWDAAGFSSADDGSEGPIVFPFTFDLYGQTFNQVWINVNGNVTFDNWFTTFTATGFPTAGPVMVAPFWADVDLSANAPGVNEVWYKVTPTAVIVNWVNVGYFSAHTDKLNTFQLIITDGNDPIIGIGKNVSFCYQDMQWTTGDASQGNGGFGGTAASVGANHGNGVDFIQFGRFDQIGTAYDGPFGVNDGIDWLDNKNFVFTTNVSTNNIPPIASSLFLCDTLTVCVGELTQIPFDFIAPEATQTVTALSSSAGLSNYTEIANNSPNIAASIIGQFVPLPTEVGFQNITFVGTDNGTPPLTATYNIAVEVLPAPPGDSATVILCNTDPPLNLFSLFTTMNPNGVWSDASGNPFSGIYDPLVDSSGIFVYSDTLVPGPCPSTGLVVVNEFGANAAGNDAVISLCSSDPDSLLFPLLGPNAATGGNWLDPAGNVFSGQINPSVNGSGDYSYLVQATPQCIPDTAFVSVTIDQAVNAGGFTFIGSCESDPVFDLLSVLQGNPDTGGVWLGPNLTPIASTLDPLNAVNGVYTYVLAGAGVCPPDTSNVTLIIDTLLFAGNDNALALCEDAATSDLNGLIGFADPGGIWSDPLGNQHSGILDPTVDVTGVYNYVVSSAGNCSGETDTAFVNATISPLPVVLLSVDSTVSCTPFPVNFTNDTDTSFLDGTCTWDFGDGGMLNDCSDSIPYVYNSPGVYDVSLTITTAAGCSSTLTQTSLIDANPAPIADFIISPNPATLKNTTVMFGATDPNAIFWNWDLAGVGTFTDQTIQHTYPNTLGDEYEVCLEVIDQFGCWDTACQILTVIDDLGLFVPNAFTMDGDGLNDGFLPIAVGLQPDDYQLFIFDRWGQVMFETRDPNMPWYGAKNNNGELLPSGVYIWRILARGYADAERKEFLGHVTLLH